MIGANWRIELLMSGIGRCHDFKNVDLVKHNAKMLEVSKLLYKRFGILNMFCPHRPDGDYELNLSIYEEKTLAKILCEIAKAEGW